MALIVRIMTGLMAGTLFWLAATDHFGWLAVAAVVVWAGHAVAEAWEEDIS